jgi:hypothetical protein
MSNRTKRTKASGFSRWCRRPPARISAICCDVLIIRCAGVVGRSWQLSPMQKRPMQKLECPRAITHAHTPPALTSTHYVYRLQTLDAWLRPWGAASRAPAATVPLVELIAAALPYWYLVRRALSAPWAHKQSTRRANLSSDTIAPPQHRIHTPYYAVNHRAW